jgi:arsenate reductase (thioredoxin)
MQEQRHVVSAESRLAALFTPEISADIVRKVLADAYDELHERSTVTTYLHILAERLATRRLTDIAKRQRSIRTPTADDGQVSGALHE